MRGPTGAGRRAPGGASWWTNRYAAALALSGLVSLLTSALPAAAQNTVESRLGIEPAPAPPGSTVTVTYDPVDRLAGKPFVRLRARVHGEGRADTESTIELGDLERRADGRYRGEITLPRTFTYAALAVESSEGEIVDARRSGWEILAAGSGGRASLAAHLARVQDVWDLDLEVRARAVEEMLAASGGGDPAAWQLALADARDRLDRDAREEFEEEVRSRYLQWDRELREENPAARTLNTMAFLGQMLGEAERASFWRDRLIALHPETSFGESYRIVAAREEAEGAQETLEAFEQLWRDGIRQSPLALNGFLLAEGAGHVESLERWGRRLLDIDTTFRPLVIVRWQTHPELNEATRALVRTHLEKLEAGEALERPLDQTAAEHREQIRSLGAHFLGIHGRLLADAGHGEAALDTLQRASELSWNTEVLGTLGDLLVRSGRIEEALNAYARSAVDPAATDPITAEGAAARIGPGFDADAWRMATAGASEALRAYVRNRLDSSRRIDAPLRLADHAGRERSIDPAAAELTFYAAWSRHCPHSRNALDDLSNAIHVLREAGVRTVVVTDEDPGPAATRFLESRKLDLETLHDTWREGRRLLGVRGTPHYFLLDGDGTVIYETRGLNEMRRVALVLGDDLQ